REFDIDLTQFHNDTTTVTFAGAYRNQESAEQLDRPPRITFGYNKDHRPDLKQLLFSITVSNDGAVPLHCKTYDGNVTDDRIHNVRRRVTVCCGIAVRKSATRTVPNGRHVWSGHARGWRDYRRLGDGRFAVTARHGARR